MRQLQRAIALVSVSTFALTGPATAQGLKPRPDTLTLGRNAVDEPCNATRNWHDTAVSDIFGQSWSISCRNVAASRALGSIRVVSSEVDLTAATKALDCGEAKAMSVKDVGDVEARRCYDSALGIETVAYDVQRGGRRYFVSVAPNVLGPAEEGLRIIAGLQKPSGDTGRATQSSIAAASLPASRAAERAGAATAVFDASVPLAEGINLNHKGLHVEASRVLNDALSRLPANALPSTRSELLLEAGLADSNIKFSVSAQEHFTEASALLSQVGGERGAFLARKRDAYVALDLLNQRKFRESLAALNKLTIRPASANEPLNDPAIVRVLNQGNTRKNDVSSSIALPETGTLAQLTLDAQANWARSVALFALGDVPASQAALDRAQLSYAPLINERIDPTQILWLGAHIDRQRGRLLARRKQYPEAIAAFDRALVELRRSSVGTAGTGNEPTIAETQLERAGIIADQGGDPTHIRGEYDQAVDALIAANKTGGGILPVGIERYFEVLVAEAKNGAKADTYERYFRAMQAVGEPAVARQLSQLQNVVTADPKVGVKVRDRAELERTITRLRYDIAASTDAAATADLEKQRRQAETKLLQIDGELSSSARFRTIDDRPATIEEVRKALKTGEVFIKVAALNRQAFGIVVSVDRTFIYPLIAPTAALEAISHSVRQSIDGRLNSDGQLVPFDVASSYALFGLLTGPATEAVLKANALVVDTASAMQNLPAGVLVTDRASVDRYAASSKAAPFDFSKVSFLAQHATISTAVSPRSFLVVRSLAPSAAHQPFLGLGQHLPAVGDGGPRRMVSVGFGCQVEFSTLADYSRRLVPIDKKELELASVALGVPQAPEMTGAEFSDTAVEARTDLADFEVLHFATHGLEEGVWGCSKSPPALVTSFGDKNSDGLLSFAEIAQLRLDANLVVLSACDTASGVKDEALARRSGQEEAGSTLEGLVRAFLTANSRAVLATFWPVSADKETDQFIKAFYGSARELNIGGALQIAQRTLIAEPEYSHPFYWGPYFIVGDSTKMMLTGAARQAGQAAPKQVAAQ